MTDNGEERDMIVVTGATGNAGSEVVRALTARGGRVRGRPPTGQPVELAAIVIFRIADGKIAERWAGWKPGRAPVR